MQRWERGSLLNHSRSRAQVRRDTYSGSDLGELLRIFANTHPEFFRHNPDTWADSSGGIFVVALCPLLESTLSPLACLTTNRRHCTLYDLTHVGNLPRCQRRADRQIECAFENAFGIRKRA